MDMDNYAQQALDMYYSVPYAPKLREGICYPWHEPTKEEITQLSDKVDGTVFGHCAASLLMKLLYAARMVRLDICYAINNLSWYVSRWNALCDKQLVHLFGYIKNTRQSKLHATCDRNELPTIELHAYPDADLAGTFDSTRATSGGFIHIGGVNTFFQLDRFSKRQTATAHSTTEAELIAASKILREPLVPLMSLWSLMLDRDVKGIIHEDNMSTIEVIKTGYSAKLRHVMPRHYRTSLGTVHEMCQDPMIDVEHITTDKQKGDLMTKGLARPKHDPACKLVGLYPCIVGVTALPQLTSTSDAPTGKQLTRETVIYDGVVETYEYEYTYQPKAYEFAMCTILDRAARFAGG